MYKRERKRTFSRVQYSSHSASSRWNKKKWNFSDISNLDSLYTFYSPLLSIISWFVAWNLFWESINIPFFRWKSTQETLISGNFQFLPSRNYFIKLTEELFNPFVLLHVTRQLSVSHKIKMKNCSQWRMKLKQKFSKILKLFLSFMEKEVNFPSFSTVRTFQINCEWETDAPHSIRMKWKSKKRVFYFLIIFYHFSMSKEVLFGNFSRWLLWNFFFSLFPITLLCVLILIFLDCEIQVTG